MSCIIYRVHGEDATCASVTQVSFIGAAQDISTEIVLPLRAVRGRESLIASSCGEAPIVIAQTAILTSSNDNPIRAWIHKNRYNIERVPGNSNHFLLPPSLPLPLVDPTSPLTSSNRTSLQRPCSSVSSSQHCETCPCEVCGAGGGEEEEEEGGDYDHLPTMENLDQIHLQLVSFNCV